MACAAVLAVFAAAQIAKLALLSCIPSARPMFIISRGQPARASPPFLIDKKNRRFLFLFRALFNAYGCKYVRLYKSYTYSVGRRGKNMKGEFVANRMFIFLLARVYMCVCSLMRACRWRSSSASFASGLMGVWSGIRMGTFTSWLPRR